MVQRGCSFVEATDVPRIRKSEPLKIEMMAEFVAKCAEECSEGRDLLAHRCLHPQADHQRVGCVVAEKFASPTFTNSQRSGRKHADVARRNFAEHRCGVQKFGA